VYRYRKFTKEETMIKLSDKDELIGRAYQYAEKNIVLKQERDFFMKGVMYIANRMIWK
jgi:hypothetical protein